MTTSTIPSFRVSRTPRSPEAIAFCVQRRICLLGDPNNPASDAEGLNILGDYEIAGEALPDMRSGTGCTTPNATPAESRPQPSTLPWP